MEGVEQHVGRGGTFDLETTPFGAINMADVQTTANTTRIAKSDPDEEKETKALKGSAPKVFDGTRKDSERFWDEFNYYRKLNRKSEVMKEPYSRVLMALSYMKGDKIWDWRRSAAEQLDEQIDSGKSYNDETLWENFKQTFEQSFTDTTKKQDAYLKLKNLRMQGDDLDTYMALYRQLVLKAGWDITGDGARDTFSEGLKLGLKLAILRGRDDIPETLDDWKKAAINEQRKWAWIKHAKSEGTGRQNDWKKALGKKDTPKKDPNAMEVDNARLAPLTDAEKEQLRKEGRCFRCRLQGHLSFSCPKKTGEAAKKTTYTQARITEVVDDRDDVSEAGSDMTVVPKASQKSTKSPKINNVKMMPADIVKALGSLTEEERGDVLDKILQEGEDF